MKFLNFLSPADGVLVFFSKSHTQKLRESLATKSNCYFFLGDKFNIAHFELRWVPDVNYHELPKPRKHHSPETTDNQLSETTIADTTAKETGGDSYPGTATIDIRYSGYGNEVELLKKVFDDTGKILQILEGNIRQACTDPLMKHANKMRPGEKQELQLRVVLRSSYKVRKLWWEHISTNTSAQTQAHKRKLDWHVPSNFHVIREVLFIKTSIQSSMMNITSMIPLMHVS